MSYEDRDAARPGDLRRDERRCLLGQRGTQCSTLSEISQVIMRSLCTMFKGIGSRKTERFHAIAADHKIRVFKLLKKKSQPRSRHAFNQDATRYVLPSPGHPNKDLDAIPKKACIAILSLGKRGVGRLVK